VTAFFFPKSKSEEAAKREKFSAKTADWDNLLTDIRDYNAQKSDKYAPKTEENLEKFFNSIEKEFNLLKSKMSQDGLG